MVRTVNRILNRILRFGVNVYFVTVYVDVVMIFVSFREVRRGCTDNGLGFFYILVLNTVVILVIMKQFTS